MLECLSFNSLSPSLPNLRPAPSLSQENSTQDPPATSPNVSLEYNLAIQADSYNEIQSVIQVHHIEVVEEEDEDSHHHVLTQVLYSDRNSIREALDNSKPGKTLTHICSSYFDHSEATSLLCLQLYRTVHRARHIYSPLFDFLSVLPADSPSLPQPQCDHAYDLFLQFDSYENPFIFPHFLNLRHSFSVLRRDIEHNSRKCQHRIRLLRHATVGCAVCCVATTAAAIVSSAMIAAHAAVGFTAVIAAQFCIPRPGKSKKKEVRRLKQLKVAESGTFVADDIDTIGILVDRLKTEVEGNKVNVRFALERGRERHPIQEVLKQLRKTQPILEQLLQDLEEHIYLCFYTVKKARDALLREISLHQTP